MIPEELRNICPHFKMALLYMTLADDLTEFTKAIREVSHDMSSDDLLVPIALQVGFDIVKVVALLRVALVTAVEAHEKSADNLAGTPLGDTQCPKCEKRFPNFLGSCPWCKD